MFEVVVTEVMLVPVVVVVIVVLFPGKLMTVDEVDVVDVPLPELVPVVTAVVVVLRCNMRKRFPTS